MTASTFVMIGALGALVVLGGLVLSVREARRTHRASLTGLRMQAAGTAWVAAVSSIGLIWLALGASAAPIIVVPAAVLGISAIVLGVFAVRVRIQE